MALDAISQPTPSKFPTTALKRYGYLMKMGSSVGWWHKRFVVCDQTGIFVYKTDKHASAKEKTTTAIEFDLESECAIVPVGELQAADAVSWGDQTHRITKANCFRVRSLMAGTKDRMRTYYFAAANEVQRNEWVQAINDCIAMACIDPEICQRYAERHLMYRRFIDLSADEDFVVEESAMQLLTQKMEHLAKGPVQPPVVILRALRAPDEISALLPRNVSGLFVVGVTENTIGGASGLVAGEDVIIAIDGNPVKNVPGQAMRDLYEARSQHRLDGQPLVLKVYSIASKSERTIEIPFDGSSPYPTHTLGILTRHAGATLQPKLPATELLSSSRPTSPKPTGIPLELAQSMQKSPSSSLASSADATDRLLLASEEKIAAVPQEQLVQELANISKQIALLCQQQQLVLSQLSALQKTQEMLYQRINAISPSSVHSPSEDKAPE